MRTRVFLAYVLIFYNIGIDDFDLYITDKNAYVLTHFCVCPYAILRLSHDHYASIRRHWLHLSLRKKCVCPYSLLR